MSDVTLEAVIDRLLVSYLTPANDQDIQVRLGSGVDDSTQTITLGGFTIPEDEALLRQGSILELERELVRVVEYDDLAGSVTVTRGIYSTTPAAHTTPLLMNLNPQFTRDTVFQAVADTIITLYPRLFTTNVEYLSTVSGGVFPINDDLAVELLSAWVDGWTGSTEVHGEIVDYHPLAGGRAIILNHPMGGAMWMRYRRRMARAESEADTLDDLGVDERWVNIIMAGAAADLLAGKDIPASETEWVKSVLEAENIQVGTRMSIAGGLRQYHGMLLDRAANEMRAEYKPKVRMRNPMKSIV
jgi:hypothetical protein